MPPSWLTLTDDEEVQWWEHPSHYAHLVGYGLGFAIAAAGGLLVIASLELALKIGSIEGWVIGVGLLVVGAGIAAIEYVRRRSTHYVLTTKHVYKKRGILSRSVDPVRLDRIAEFEYSQSIPDRLFGIGEVRIMTAGTEGTDLVLEHVPAVQDFSARLSEVLDRHGRSQ